MHQKSTSAGDPPQISRGTGVYSATPDLLAGIRVQAGEGRGRERGKGMEGTCRMYL